MSTAPLTYKFGADWFVTLFRFGVVALMGLTAAEEADVLRSLQPRLIRPIKPSEEESVLIELVPDKDDQILPGGPITLKTITPDHLIVIADALSKSVVLARDEREVAAVFELVEPFARRSPSVAALAPAAAPSLSTLATRCWFSTAFPAASRSRKSRTWSGIAPISIGFMRGWKTNTSCKSAPKRCSSRKLKVIAGTAQVFTDIMDAKRTFRLEIIIVVLIAVELLIAAYQTLTLH